MAKFLNTTGVSYHLEELIKGTKDRLILQFDLLFCCENSYRFIGRSSTSFDNKRRN